jgi:Icc-related predicted phosphoesterase
VDAFSQNGAGLELETTPGPSATGGPDGHRPRSIRIAAAGDIHCRESRRDEIEAAFAALAGEAQLVLLAGDLTTQGHPAEAKVLADACERLGVPAVAVLGNHDWHGGQANEVTDTLTAGGVTVLDRGYVIQQAGDTEVGIVGTKGFVGGFTGSHLPDFGEPLLRAVYAETSREAEAIDEGLRAVSMCPVRIVLLHYAPTAETLVGEPEGIWTFLGSDRLAPPICEHSPDLVLHGHAHAGRLEGKIADVPVFNVSVPVMERDFWLFELSGVENTLTSIH